MYHKILLPLADFSSQDSCSPDCPVAQFKQEGRRTAASSTI